MPTTAALRTWHHHHQQPIIYQKKKKKNPRLLTPPSPHPTQTWQTQTKPMANPQPNTDLHTTPKHWSLRQTPNADLHATTLIYNEREKRNNEWMVVCHGQWQWVGPWCGGYGVLILKRGSEWGLKGERESEIERRREREMWDRERNWPNRILVFCFRIVLQCKI